MALMSDWILMNLIILRKIRAVLSSYCFEVQLFQNKKVRDVIAFYV